jgi:hypothetical protein
VKDVYEDVFRLLRGQPMLLPKTPAGALGEHLGGGAAGGVAPELVRAAPKTADPEDPGYLDLTPPAPARVEEVKAQLDADAIPEFRRLRIL